MTVGSISCRVVAMAVEETRMPTLKLDITENTLERLRDLACKERRFVPQQAEVLLLKALGLWTEQGAAERERLHDLPESVEVRCRR
jgi:hypothetical protein